MKIAIVGFGREGKSVLKFIKTRPEYKKAEMWILDGNGNLEIPPGLRSELGKNYLKNVASFDIVFRSPGIPYNLPELKAARRKGVVFSSLTRLFFAHCPSTVIGVTGTKGKGTTATLIYKYLKNAKKEAHLVGNIGAPALDGLNKMTEKGFVVYELSSFQLQDLEQSPHVAVVLEMFPDHQEDIKTAKHGTHASLREYYEAKAAVCRYQKRGDVVFYFAHNKVSATTAGLGKGKKIPVTERGFKLFKESDLKIRGLHNHRNAIAATMVAKYLGIGDEVIKKTIKTYTGLEHRLEFVREIKKKNGIIRFYNDSQSTSPQPTIAAMNAFPTEDDILLLGGHDKNLPYGTLAKALKRSSVRLAVLLGANRKKILAALKKENGRNAPYRIAEAKSFEDALETAYRFAASDACTSPVRNVILSPATSSFDMFKSYADRGAYFKKSVKSLR